MIKQLSRVVISQCERHKHKFYTSGDLAAANCVVTIVLACDRPRPTPLSTASATCTDDENSISYPYNSVTRDIFLKPIMANEDIVVALETGKVIRFKNENGREVINMMLSLDGGEYEQLTPSVWSRKN